MFDNYSCESFKKLDSVIGLESVKEEIHRVVEYNVRMAAATGKAIPGNYAFVGNPGTGKTMVARLMGEIMHSQGLLEKGHVVEVQKSDLLSVYIGQTAAKTRGYCMKALGGVLYVDDAYQLVNTDSASSNIFPSSFDEEAYNELMKCMEEYRENLCVIFAGYKKEMETFRLANPGMARRITKTIVFEDYSDDGLYAILQVMAQKMGITLSDDFKEHVQAALKTMREVEGENFGNALSVRSFLEACAQNAVARAFIQNPLVLITADIPARYIEGVCSPNHQESSNETNPIAAPEKTEAQFKLIPKSIITDLHTYRYAGAILRISSECGTATGFLISPLGYAITCAHAVVNYEQPMKAVGNLKAYKKDFERNEKEYPCEVINVRTDFDIALIKVIAENEFPFLRLAPETKTIISGGKCIIGSSYTDNVIRMVPSQIMSPALDPKGGDVGNQYYIGCGSHLWLSGAPVITDPLSDGCVIGIMQGVKKVQDGSEFGFMKPISYFWKEFLK